METKSKTSVSRAFSNPLNFTYELFELIGVIVLAAVAVIAVSEMSSRDAFSSSTAQKIAALNVDLASITLNLPSSDAPISKYVLSERENATSKIKAFERLQDKVTTLIVTGVDEPQDTLKVILSQYQAETGSYSPENIASKATSLLEELSNSDYISFIYEMRSDHLMALAVICCSALGAMIFGLRSGAKMNIRTLSSGLATGFVVYLALKGGQHIFLMSSPDIRLPANPYSSAFAGLLAGLFSDKAYKVLSSLVDNLASQIENANGDTTVTNTADKKPKPVKSDQPAA